MIKCVNEFIVDVWTDGWLGRLVLLVLGLGFSLLLTFVSWATYAAVDSFGVKSDSGAVEVIRKDYRPSYTYLMPVGKIVVPQIQPEQWYLGCQVGNKTAWVRVSREFHDAIQVGAKVQGNYHYGRLSKDLHIEELYLNK